MDQKIVWDSNVPDNVLLANQRDHARTGGTVSSAYVKCRAARTGCVGSAGDTLPLASSTHLCELRARNDVAIWWWWW